MFNLKRANSGTCIRDNSKVWVDPYPSYIEVVRWDSFIDDYKIYIDAAIKRQNNIDDYEITKEF